MRNSISNFCAELYLFPERVTLHTCRQFSTRENGQTRISCHQIIFFFFFFKPAISLPEQVQVIIFPPNVSIVARGVHGYEAIVFLQLHISAVDRDVHHSKHKTTPFLFEADRPGGRVRAHTLRLRIVLEFVLVLVRAHT